MCPEYKYSFHPELRLEKNDWGKCIIYLLQENYTFYFNVSKIQKFLPRNTDLQSLREIFKDYYVRENFAGLHRNIPTLGEGKAKIFGGGTYFMVKDKSIFVDNESGDFGGMNKSLLIKLLETQNIKLETLDDEFFNCDPLNQYLYKRSLPPAESTIIIKNSRMNTDDRGTPQIEDDDFPF